MIWGLSLCVNAQLPCPLLTAPSHRPPTPACGRWQRDGSDALPGLRLMQDTSSLQKLVFMSTSWLKFQSKFGIGAKVRQR